MKGQGHLPLGYPHNNTAGVGSDSPPRLKREALVGPSNRAEGGSDAERAPNPPAGLCKSGRALWRAVLGDYVLDEHETTILREACRTADSLDVLQAQIESDGVMSESSQGSRVHPALVEIRQQRITFARLLTALRIPQGETDGRTQSRGGPRGVYGITGPHEAPGAAGPQVRRPANAVDPVSTR